MYGVVWSLESHPIPQEPPHARRHHHTSLPGTVLHYLHCRRLAPLLAAVASCMSGPRLALTDLGRRFEGGAKLHHKIKCSDRLLGNRRLQGERGRSMGRCVR